MDLCLKHYFTYVWLKQKLKRISRQKIAMRRNKKVIISLFCIAFIYMYVILNSAKRDSELLRDNSNPSPDDNKRNSLLFDKRFQNGLQSIESQITDSIRLEKQNIVTDKTVGDKEKQIVKNLIKSNLHQDSLKETIRSADVITKKSSQTPTSDPGFPPFVAWNPQNGIGENNQNPNWNLNELSAHDRNLYDKGYAKHYFNQFLSDRISVTRRLPDFRSNYCKSRNYTNLPDASVIIVFRNEAWSTLLRTVRSILDRSPAHLIKEIILVDDDSTYDFLKAPLETYMTSLLKVKILRTGKREGLIRARIIGYQAARAPVLVFLDSHIECFPGWLEPLLERIHENSMNVPFPQIERISRHTFQINDVPVQTIGSFHWGGLLFKWNFAFDDGKQQDARKSPTMPGGLFAIDRNYFTKLGTFDPELYFWGGENMELSFKVWMCNGSVEIALCSHIGHVYRDTNPNPWSWNKTKDILPPALINSLRVADVWLDEYKEYVFQQINITNYYKSTKSDVSDRRKLRQSLHCKTFDWYMKNVHPTKFIPNDTVYVGEIRSAAFVENHQYCLDSMGNNGKPAQLFGCHGEGYNQDQLISWLTSPFFILILVSLFRQFLGFAGYYRKYVKNVSKVARPLTDLLASTSTKKGKRNRKHISVPSSWYWGPEQQSSFDALVTALSTEPVSRGVLYRLTKINGDDRKQLILPAEYRKNALHSVHNDAGHQGRDRTLSLLQERFYFPGMSKRIDDWTKGCSRCLRRKSNVNIRASLFWMITDKGQIRQNSHFVCYSDGELKKQRSACELENNQPVWEYTEDQWLRHNSSGLCLEATEQHTLVMRICQNKTYQQWIAHKREKTYYTS